MDALMEMARVDLIESILDKEDFDFENVGAEIIVDADMLTVGDAFGIELQVTMVEIDGRTIIKLVE